MFFEYVESKCKSGLSLDDAVHDFILNNVSVSYFYKDDSYYTIVFFNEFGETLMESTISGMEEDQLENYCSSKNGALEVFSESIYDHYFRRDDYLKLDKLYGGK